MKIEFWSDFRCPICYIAKQQLLDAIFDLNLQNQVELYFRAFVLDPNLLVSEGGNIHESLATTKGITIEQAQLLTQKVEQIARHNQLSMDYANCYDANTEKAHLLSYFALENDKQLQVHQDIMEAYFVENKNIDEDSVLNEIVRKNQLDLTEWADFSENDEKINELQNDLIQNREAGILAVPFVAINEAYAINGAKSKSYYTQILHQFIQNNGVWDESSTTD